jgi:iron complex outermembrane receptor protein
MSLERAPTSLDVGIAPIIEGSSPQHQVMVQSYFDVLKSLTLDISYRYISALPGELVPAYSTANVHVGWRLTPHVKLSLVGDNLFRPRHAESSGDPGPLVLIKRSAYGEVTWTQ